MRYEFYRELKHTEPAKLGEEAGLNFDDKGSLPLSAMATYLVGYFLQAYSSIYRDFQQAVDDLEKAERRVEELEL